MPTAETVPISMLAPVSTRTRCPTVMPVMLATLMFVSPALAPAGSVVAAAAAVPTAAIVPNSRLAPVSNRTWWPTVIPVTLATLTFVSPALVATGSVVAAAAAVPTAVTVTLSAVPAGSTASGMPTAMFVTLATLMFVSPAAGGAASVVCPPSWEGESSGFATL